MNYYIKDIRLMLDKEIMDKIEEMKVKCARYTFSKADEGRSLKNLIKFEQVAKEKELIK